MSSKNSIKNLLIASTVGFLLSIFFIAYIGEFVYYNAFKLRENPKKERWVFINKLNKKIIRNSLYAYNVNKENYISRCVAISGDFLQIKAAKLYVNKQVVKSNANYYLYQFTSNKSLSDSLLKYEFDFTEKNINGLYLSHVILHNYQHNYLSKFSSIYKTSRIVKPLTCNKLKNIDFFRSIYIPRRGDKVIFDSSTYSFYAKSNEKIMPTTNNKFYFIAQHDYVFMLNDFRNCIHDSRKFGLIEKEYILGKTPDN